MDRIEQYYEIVNRCDRCLTILLAARCLVLWVRPFVRGRREAFRVAAAYAGTLLFLLFMPYTISGRLAYLLGSLAAFGAVCLTDRQYVRQKMFVVAVHYCLQKQAAEIISHIGFISLLAQDWVVVYAWEHGLRILESGEQWFLVFCVEQLVDAALYFGMLYGAVRLMQRLYGCRREQISVFEFALLAAPIALCGAVRRNARYVNVYREQPWVTVLNGEKYDWYEVYSIGLTLLSSAVLFITVYVFRRWKDGQEEEKQRELLSRQMADLESHIAQVERLYREMRGLRHDMGNHLMTLRRLYDVGEYEAAGQYAETLDGQIRETSVEAASGNPVTDVILSERKREMEEKGIAFDCDFHYPQGGNVNAFDISVILHNALANAIEAVEKTAAYDTDDRTETDGRPPKTAKNMTHVSLTSRRVKNMYMIEVANDWEGELTVDPASGLPVSTKEGEGHGFGLSGIRRVARRYLGDVEVESTERGGRTCFVLRVMLQMTPGQEGQTVHDR